MIEKIKKIILIVVTILLIAGLAACEKEEPVVSKDNTFEIYLATLKSVSEFGPYDYENLELYDTPVITGDDIRAYYWQNHEIEVTSSYIESLNKSNSSTNTMYYENGEYREYVMGGSRLLTSFQLDCFVIIVDGIRVYSGTFPDKPSDSFKQKDIFIGDVSDTDFKIFFTGEGLDPRNADLIYNYFLKNEKLQITDATNLEKRIDELTTNIDLLLEENKKLKKENEDYASSVKQLEEQKDYYESATSWLNERAHWYMLETEENENTLKYSDYLLNLDQSDVWSIKYAGDTYREYATDNKIDNDRMFNLFETFYYSSMRRLETVYQDQIITEDIIDLFLKNGIMLSKSGSNIILKPKAGYFIANFGPYLSYFTNEYFKTLDYEITIFNNNDVDNIIENAKVSIPLNELADIIIKWERYTYNNGYYGNNNPFRYKGSEKLLYYFNIYSGKVFLENSPCYNENKTLTEQYKISFQYMMDKYYGTESGKLIIELYQMLEANDFHRDINIEEFYQKTKYDLLF
ncbi:MAG: hypothetical protein JXQ23_12605 [Clostridia bacterium]|nr:hypothetical protein [Clostridia bacterium]